MKDPAKPVSFPLIMKTGIEFDHVSFRYPSGTRDVLANINLRIRPGEIVALVGLNGAGKSTLVKLLCRLYDPTDGSITINGINVCQFEVSSLRRAISVLLQDYGRYHFTARENIWLGDLACDLDDERIVTAARNSGANAVIGRLPQGLDTVLGKRFEEGEELSIGEWQRMALARSLLREGSILVLDEPSGALDVLAEAQLYATIRRLAAGRAVILIGHRLKALRIADRIYVLERGMILESGTHCEPMVHDGIYAGLYRVQDETGNRQPPPEVDC